MAEYTIYWDPNADPGGDGTTTNLSGDGTHACNSLSAAETAGQSIGAGSGDIVNLVGLRQGSAYDVGNVLVSGWNSGVYVNIYPHTDYRHEGEIADQRSDSNYICKISANNTNGIQPGGPIISIDGILFTWSAASSSIKYGIFVLGYYASTTTFDLSNCLIDGINDFCAGVYLAEADIQFRGRNIVGSNLTGKYSGLIWDVACAAGSYLYNSTCYTAHRGITATTNLLLKNNASFNCTDVCFKNTPAAGSDYNVSSDSSAVGTNKATGKTDYANYFVDPANGDFHLKGTSSTLWGLAGADLSGTFTDDIDGDTRSAWDIGADEYAVVGGQTGELTDSLSLTASDSGTAHFLASISDQFGFGGGTGGTAAYIAALVDSMAVGDVVSGVAGLVASLSDSMSLTGNESASTLASGALADALVLSDQAASVAHLFALLSDTATLSDAAGALLRAKGSVADIIALADTHGGVGGFIAGLVDNLSYVDEVFSPATGATGALSDVLSIGDANAGQGHYVVTVNDSITVTDAAAGIARYLRTLSDIFSLTDAVSTTISINGPVTVSVTVLQATTKIEVVAASATYEVI